MLVHAIDTPPPATFILISNNHEFAYAVSMLRLRRYRVIVVSSAVGHSSMTLKAHATAFLDWDTDVLMETPYSSSNPLVCPTPQRLDGTSIVSFADRSQRFSRSFPPRSQSIANNYEVDIMDHIRQHSGSEVSKRLFPSMGHVSNVSPHRRLVSPN